MSSSAQKRSQQKRIQKKSKRNSRVSDRKPTVRRKLSRAEVLMKEALDRGDYATAATLAAQTGAAGKDMSKEDINESINQILPQVIQIHAMLEIYEHGVEHDIIGEVLTEEEIAEADRLIVKIVESIEAMLKVMALDVDIAEVADLYVYMLSDVMTLNSDVAPSIVNKLEEWGPKLDKVRDQLVEELQANPAFDNVAPLVAIQQTRMSRVYPLYSTPVIKEEQAEETNV